MKDSFKDVLTEMLDAEMDVSLGYSKNETPSVDNDNKRNGYTTKTVKSQYGEFPLEIPRKRNGKFEPQIVPKYKRDISGIEDKVISLYAHGISTRDIWAQLQYLYGIETSTEMVSNITGRILSAVKELQSRPLNPVYTFAFMNTIHYKVRDEGRIINRVAYIVLGVILEGTKDILSIAIEANESSKFWLGMLNDLKNRDVKRMSSSPVSMD